jgi:hypothetical protein
METPVLCFTVRAKQLFREGHVREGHDHRVVSSESAVQRTNTDGAIRWDAVRLMPGSHTVLPQADT